MKKRHLCAVAASTAMLFGFFGSAPAYADPSPEEVQSDIDELSEELEELIEEYNGAKEDLEETEERIEEIEEQLPELEAEVEETREIVGDIAYTSYVNGHHDSSLETVLEGSPESALQKLTVLGAVTSSQASDVADFNASSTELHDEQAELEELLEEQQELVDELDESKETIEGDMDDLEDLLRQVDPPSSGIGDAPPASGDAAAVVQFGYDQVGKPYQWGASGPDAYDCSGLTSAAWQQAGVSLSHQASRQWNETNRVGREDLQPGDLVFYNDLSHVAIYVGDNQIVHAPTSGQTIHVTGIDAMPIVGYGRP